MISKALLIAFVAFALLTALEGAAKFHPLALAADAIGATHCDSDWSRDACKAAAR